MEVIVGVLSSISTAVVIAIAAFLARNVVVERLRVELRKEHSKFMDELQWNRKVQEQAVHVAEYLALARRLEETSPESDYRKANQLSWELAMWLPADIYRKMTIAIARPSAKDNEGSVAIAARKILLGDKAGDLSDDDIAHHAPGIGKKRDESTI